MDAREFLVTTVHEIAISTEFAITARASEEADTDTLTNRPALHARAKGVDPPDHFVPRDARPADWKGGFHRAGIRVADTARLDANAHLTGARIEHRFHYGFEFSRFRYLDCSIHCAHIASLIWRAIRACSPDLRRGIGDPNQCRMAVPGHRKCNTLSKSTASGATCFKALRKREIHYVRAASKRTVRCYLS